MPCIPSFVCVLLPGFLAVSMGDLQTAAKGLSPMFQNFRRRHSPAVKKSLHSASQLPVFTADGCLPLPPGNGGAEPAGVTGRERCTAEGQAGCLSGVSGMGSLPHHCAIPGPVILGHAAGHDLETAGVHGKNLVAIKGLCVCVISFPHLTLK